MTHELGIPMANVNLLTGAATNPSWSGMNSILSEFGTLSMEFYELTYHTGDQTYMDKIKVIMDMMEKRKPERSLYPIYFNPHTSSWSSQQVTLGGLGDSFYEYLLKYYILTGDQRTKK